MGMLELLSNAFKFRPLANRKAKCPKCATEVTLGLERCPKCGTHIESMFRIECPKCKTANELKSEKCVKCGNSFVESRQPASGKQSFRCPICGYVADYYMMSCPSCGVKFV